MRTPAWRKNMRQRLRRLGIPTDGSPSHRVQRLAMQRAVAKATQTAAVCNSLLCRAQLREATVGLFFSFESMRRIVDRTPLAPTTNIALDTLEDLWWACCSDANLAYTELATPILSQLTAHGWPRQTRSVWRLRDAVSRVQNQMYAAGASASAALARSTAAFQRRQRATAATQRHTATLRMAMTAVDFCKVVVGEGRTRRIFDGDGGDDRVGDLDLLCFDPTPLITASRRVRKTRRATAISCLGCDGTEECEVVVGRCPRGATFCRESLSIGHFTSPFLQYNCSFAH